MKKKNLNIEYIRNNFRLQFILYTTEVMKAIEDSESFQTKKYRLSDEASYYKSKKYVCFKNSPIVSKLDILKNPDHVDQ